MSGARLIGQFPGGMQRNLRAGDALLSTAIVTSVATDGNVTLDVAKMAGGIVQYTGFSAGRDITTDTAANIIAAFPQLDIGESVEVVVSIVPAFAGTWVAGNGVTLAGRATTPASTSTCVIFTKTAATTVTATVL